MGAFIHKSSAWQPPMELQRFTPREIQLTGAGKALVVAAIVLVVTAVGGSIALAVQAAADESRWKSWSAEAMYTPGQIIDLRKRGSGDETKYYVDYSYRVSDTSYSSTGQVRSGEWRRMKQGETPIVFYRRSEPSQSWLAGHEPKGVPWFTALLFGAALLIPVPVMVHFLRRQQQLLEQGRAAEATVVKVKKQSGHQHEGRNYYTVEYEFKNMEGSLRIGKFNINRAAPEIGDTLTVVYHPDEERWSARYPLSLVRVRAME